MLKLNFLLDNFLQSFLGDVLLGALSAPANVGEHFLISEVSILPSVKCYRCYLHFWLGLSLAITRFYTEAEFCNIPRS